jgi:hypothetical protein
MAKGKRGIGPQVTADEPTVEQAATAEQSQQTERQEREPRPGAPVKRLAIPFDSNGKVMWDTMRASTKEEVRKVVEGMLRDRELAASFGIDKPLVEVFPPEWTGALYDALGAVETALAPKLFGIDSKIAAQIFPFTLAEKEKLAGPTSKVINKYAVDWMIRFKEEIALLMLLASITYAKVMAAKMAQQLMTAATQSVPKPNGKDHSQETAAA